MSPADAGPARGRDRRPAVLGALVATLTTLGAVLAKSWCGQPAGDVDQYLRWCYTDVVPLWFVERLDVGAVPYLDHPVEYPPLTGLQMWLASLPASSSGQFLLWTALGALAAAAATGWVLGREVGYPRVLVFAAAPTLLVSGMVNWDMLPVLCAAGGLVAHRRGHDGWAGVLLGLGAAAKAWPALLVPGVALGAWSLRGPRAGLVAFGASAGTWAAVNLPVALVATDGWLRFFELSRERAVDWDSLWRVVPLRLGGTPPAAADVNPVITALTLLGIAALLVVAVRTTPPSTWHLVGLPVVTWFLLVGKVWSPQFTLWLLPLLALAAPGVPGLVALAVTDVAVTLTRFPFLGAEAGLEGGWAAWPFEVAVLARAVVVVVLAWTAWRRAADRARVPDGPAPPATARADATATA